MVFVTRQVHFCAAHRLFDPDMSEEENRRRYGDRIRPHGHNYTLEVTFGGAAEPATGMLVHLSDIDRAVRERVVDRVDHTDLNADLPLGPAPTVELLAGYMWGELCAGLHGADLVRVTLIEDSRVRATRQEGSDMVYLMVPTEFNAVHRLCSAQLSAEQNRDRFGECANLHGHLYRLEITVAGNVSPVNPTVMTPSAIDEMTETVRARLNNSDLNEVFGKEGFISTGENVTGELWKMIEPILPDSASLVQVRLVETPKNSFTYLGPNPRLPVPLP